MKVWQIQSPGGFDNLALVDRDEPELGPGQVRLHMRAWSLNYRDLLIIKNPPSSRPSLIPLSDGVGEVVAVGDGVTQVKVGDRVATTFFQNWVDGPISGAVHPSALGGAIDGVLAESVVLSESGVVLVPDHLSDEEAATLPCAGLTAWNAVVSDGQLKAGDTILLQGTGGVSIFALQFAQMLGVRAIATSSSNDKLDRVLAMGAAYGINYKTEPEWDVAVWKLTHEQGVDRVIEVGGGRTFNQSLRAARYGGQVSVIGVLTGFGGDVSTVTISQKGLRVEGFYVGSRAMFEQMNQAIARHAIRPVIDSVFPFEQAVSALRYMETGAHFGKVVIRR
ncbi:MAG TPA: NAD(P)-dependent alcohol dehydrogenase [Chroococcidiopsis sp.]